MNLRPFNNFVPYETFRMEGIHLLKDFLKPNYFMTKVDMKDAYYSIPIDKQLIRYLNRNTLFVIDLLESLGFRINKEISELIPSHRIPFFRIRRVLSSKVYQPSNGKDSFNPVHGNAYER